MIKKTIIMIFVCLLLIPTGNTQDKKSKAKFILEEELGLRKYNLYSEEDGFEFATKYSMSPPGTATRIERAFENAPPMIPHMVKGFLPIKANNNICVTCHMPALAVALKSTAIPLSHMSSFRPDFIEKDGKFVVDAMPNEVVIKDMQGKLNPARFNCTQCHAPQSQISVNLNNIFKADFLTEEGRTTSNFIEVLKEGVK